MKYIAIIATAVIIMILKKMLSLKSTKRHRGLINSVKKDIKELDSLVDKFGALLRKKDRGEPTPLP